MAGCLPLLGTLPSHFPLCRKAPSNMAAILTRWRRSAARPLCCQAVTGPVVYLNIGLKTPLVTATSLPAASTPSMALSNTCWGTVETYSQQDRDSSILWGTDPFSYLWYRHIVRMPLILFSFLLTAHAQCLPDVTYNLQMRSSSTDLEKRTNTAAQ